MFCNAPRERIRFDSYSTLQIIGPDEKQHVMKYISRRDGKEAPDGADPTPPLSSAGPQGQLKDLCLSAQGGRGVKRSAAREGQRPLSALKVIHTI